MKKQYWFFGALALMLVLLTAAPAQAALPTNLSWIKEATNPVANGTLCYSGEHVDPALVVESADNYKMYFSPRTDGADIYLATTTDGGLNWTCSGGAVLTRGGGGTWDETRVTSASVVKDGASDYKMWYAGRSAAGAWAIGYATSSDGVSWTKHLSNPVLNVGTPSQWDGQYVREPSVLNVSGTYHMWYSGTVKWPFFRIGHATSLDGINWNKDAGNPVLTPTTGSWDANEVYAPSVVANGSDYEMFYSGNSGGRWLTGHATASNANGPWTKDANAFLSPDSTGWEAGFDSADYVGAVLDGSTWKVFYSAGGAYQIGLTTLTNQAQLTFNQLGGAMSVGGSQVVAIDMNNVTNLYGYQFKVNYDASKVSAVGMFVNSFYDTTSDAIVVPGWNASCAAGVCKFSVSKKAPNGTASSGSGTLAQITFTGLAPGDSTITFTEDLLSEEGAVPIIHGITTGFLTVFGSATVNGTVQMQGRTFPTDAGSVTVYDQFGYAPPTTVAFSGVDGTFSATVPLYPGSTTFDVEAAHSLYLTNRLTGIVLTNGGTYPAGTTVLKGGDADNSGKVDVPDLTCVGGHFGGVGALCGTTGNSDITNDGVVNIFDLVLVGGNYDLASPRPW